jgi:hypothetical protein
MHLLYSSGFLLVFVSVSIFSESDKGRRVKVEDDTSPISINNKSRDAARGCKQSNELEPSAAKNKSITRQNCSPTPYRLTVSNPGCKSEKRIISACYGVCISSTSPSARVKNRYSLTTRRSNCCVPVQLSTTTVRLHCKKEKRAFVVRKLVEIAQKCSCRPCLDRHIENS